MTPNGRLGPRAWDYPQERRGRPGWATVLPWVVLLLAVTALVLRDGFASSALPSAGSTTILSSAPTAPSIQASGPDPTASSPGHDDPGGDPAAAPHGDAPPRLRRLLRRLLVRAPHRHAEADHAPARPDAAGLPRDDPRGVVRTGADQFGPADDEPVIGEGGGW
jgi:hypothetical protein